MKELKDVSIEDLGFDSKDFGVTKDIDSYTDIIGKQIYYVNQLLTVLSNNKEASSVTSAAIDVLRALLSPYLDDECGNEILGLEQETALKLRLLRSDRRSNQEAGIILRFLIQKYSILLKYAKDKGFLPKNLKQEY